ncbi:MAG: malate dehydrogenase (quinone) [Pirellulales bacterium]
MAAESSDAMNNAGTGHSAFCELNYTPKKADGSVDISKAIKIAEQFEVSKQLWAYLIEKGYIKNPESFITSVSHSSFVWGNENVPFLKKRHEMLSAHHLFAGMQYSESHETLAKWFPLFEIMQCRDEKQPIAATKMDLGTDVNFGESTRFLFKHLQAQNGVSLDLNTEVLSVTKTTSGTWKVVAKNLKTGEKSTREAKFVFIGAGGGALPLLQGTGIPEAKGYGGFPVSGLWLVCKNEEFVKQHQAKVYGQAEVGAPPMSVPHLDTRIINGKKSLLFGPYAGFSTKFLKEGSYADLFGSLKFGNLIPMMSAGVRNLPLTKYLIGEVMQSPEDRLKSLQKYMPTAKLEDWKLEIAGQRVQVIKSDGKGGGVLEFGTEVIASKDGSISALLGASPGASTSVPIMLELLAKCFKDQMQSNAWKTKLSEMIPSYGKSLANDKALAESIRAKTSQVLKLQA